MIDDKRIKIEEWLAKQVEIAQVKFDSAIINANIQPKHLLESAQELHRATNRLLDYVMVDKLPDNLPPNLQNVS